MLAQANSEVEELSSSLDRNEEVKLNLFMKLENANRDVMNLKGSLRNFMGFLTTHRQQFGEIESVNYAKIYEEMSALRVNEIQLPEPSFEHIFKPIRREPLVSTLISIP